jgi:hypothetical protein
MTLVSLGRPVSILELEQASSLYKSLFTLYMLEVKYLKWRIKHSRRSNTKAFFFFLLYCLVTGLVEHGRSVMLSSGTPKSSRYTQNRPNVIQRM